MPSCKFSDLHFWANKLRNLLRLRLSWKKASLAFFLRIYTIDTKSLSHELLAKVALSEIATSLHSSQ